MKKGLITASFLIFCIAITGCSKQVSQKSCNPIPLIDGFRYVKVEGGGWLLKLPAHVNIDQSYYENKENECQYAKSFSARYVWYQGKLLPHGIYADKLPSGEAGQIQIMASASNHQKFMDDFDSEKVRYKYEIDFTHNKFPLAHLPKYQWDDPVNPSRLALDLSSPPQIWAITGSNYGTPNMHYPFSVSCDFDYIAGSFSEGNVVSTGLARNGDAKCRGGILVEKNNKYIGATVFVWANLGGKDQSNIKEINKIYDALVEELNSFIQE